MRAVADADHEVARGPLLVVTCLPADRSAFARMLQLVELQGSGMCMKRCRCADGILGERVDSR